MQDMTIPQLADHWRAEADRCEDLGRTQMDSATGKRARMLGTDAETYRSLAKRNEVAAEVLRSCAHELLTRVDRGLLGADRG